MHPRIQPFRRFGEDGNLIVDAEHMPDNGCAILSQFLDGGAVDRAATLVGYRDECILGFLPRFDFKEFVDDSDEEELIEALV